MVHLLIGLRRTIARHQLAATHPASLVLMLALGVATVAGTLVIGWASYPDPATGFDVVALTSALWIGGRLAQSAVSGEPVLRPELFSLLPVSRRRLGWSLLVVGLLDPANVFLAAALAAVIPAGARLGAAAAAVAVVSVLLAVVLTSILSTVVAGLLGPGSRRGHDAGTVVTAVLISLLAVAGTLLPALITALRNQSAPWLSDLLRALPSGWGRPPSRRRAAPTWPSPRSRWPAWSWPGWSRWPPGRPCCAAGCRAGSPGAAARPPAARAAACSAPPRSPRSPPRSCGCGCATRSA